MTFSVGVMVAMYLGRGISGKCVWEHAPVHVYSSCIGLKAAGELKSGGLIHLISS